MSIVEVVHDQEWLTVEFSDGTAERFLGIWLLDNALSARHRPGGQRTFDVNALPDVSIAAATRAPDDTLTVVFAPAGRTETFPGQWLRDQAVRSTAASASPTYWRADLLDLVTSESMATLSSDPVRRREWLVGVRDLGVGLVEGLGTETGAVAEVVSLFGHVRETNYGRTFAVREEADPANLANPSAAIGMHTDNPYRDPVPGLQVLHCLVNESDGGETRLRDGFAAADYIRIHDPATFDLLSTRPVGFRFLDEGMVDLRSAVPLIELDVAGAVVGIRYNSRSIQAFDMAADILPAYYRAYRLLGEAVGDPEALVELRLESGQAVVFDNRRVLHGRSAYRGGTRHLEGCYADHDGLRSSIRVLEAT